MQKLITGCVSPRWVRLALATFVLGSAGVTTGRAQTVYNYYSGSSNAYLNASHWLLSNGNTSTVFPGTTANSSATAHGLSTDIADFGTIPLYMGAPNPIGINFSTSSNNGVTSNSGAAGSLTVGAFDFTSSLASPFTIGNSSTTNGATGTLTFTGQTLNNIPNTIISNESTQAASLVPSTSTSTYKPAMAIGLNNTTTNVIQTTNTGSIAISAVIQNGTGGSNSLTINSSGTGAVILSGANTYTGGTTVTNGTLLVNNTTGSGTGTMGVAVNGGTLGGSGSVSGTVTVASGAYLQGGNGTTNTALTLTSVPTLNSGSIIQIALDSSLNHSTLALPAGSNPFNSNQSFTFTGTPVDGTYYGIITGVSTTTNPGNWTATNGFNAYSFILDGTNIDLQITDVPEPATILGGLLLVGALGWHQRRRVSGLAGLLRNARAA